MVFPLSDDNTDRSEFPIVNVVLIALNILVFVLLQGMGRNDRFTLAYSTVPAEIRQGRDVVTENRVVRVNSINGPQEILIPGLPR